MLYAVNIKWDTDGEKIDLPNKIEIPKDLIDVDAISDYITDQTGFCHAGFDIVLDRTNRVRVVKQEV